MYTKSRRSRVVLFAFVFFLFAQLLTVPFLGSPQRVYADTNLDQLCVLPTNDLGQNDNHEQDGWLELSFVNRAVIRVKFVGAGDCVSPSGKNVAYIHASKQFSSVVDGDYYDRDTGDGTFSYVKGSGNAQSDDSRVDEFDSNFDEDISDTFGGQDKAVSADVIRRNIANIEFTLSVEEDEVEGVTCSAQNANFVFTNIDNDNKGFIWTCTNSGDSDVGRFKGVKARNAFVGRLENFNIIYSYQEGKIIHVSEGERGSRTFSWCENERRFRSNDCTGELYINATQQQMEALGANTGTFAMQSDEESGEVQVTIAGSSHESTTSTNNISGTSGADTAPSCESEGGAMSWIMCPLIFLGDAILRKLDQAIVSLLTVPNEYIDEAENPGLKVAWTRMRDISYFLLVPIVLVMVISTALGFEIVSAYTVKRALPRLIAAAIFIALSFEIGKFLIVLTNNISVGLHNAILNSFTGTGDISLATIFSPGGDDSAIGALGLIAGGGALLAVGSIGVLFSYIFVMVIGLGIGFLLLSFRQLLIIALLILAPLAILAWIFPGNDKLWKLWWGSFSKLLLLFPLIMVTIATGKAFAMMVSNTDGGSLVATLIKLIAYVGPYFLIPAMFKFAGGVFATVAGMANDRERGLFDRQKKYRQGKMSDNWGKFQAGTKYNRGSLNALSSRITTRGFGVTGRGKQAYQQKMDLASMEHAKSAQAQAVQHNDGVLRAQTYASEAEARRRMAQDWGMDEQSINEAVLGAKANGGWGRARQVFAAKQLSATGTGYDNLEQVAATIARVSYGNSGQVSSLAGDINASTKQAGRPDLAPGFGNLRDLSLGAAGLEGGSSDFHGARVAASRGMDAVSILRGKPRDVENLTTALEQHLTTQRARMTDTSLSREQREEAIMEVKQTIGQINQLHANRAYASQDNQMHVNRLVTGTSHIVHDAQSVLAQMPNAAEHADDIQRFSAPPRDQNDPRINI